ncbi:hypothetical protein OAA09_01180 [bacterium]|nr:hypothetical protein [bacterium]
MQPNSQIDGFSLAVIVTTLAILEFAIIVSGVSLAVSILGA